MFSKAIRFLGSYGLAVVLLLLLMLVTIIGTIEQKHMGLYLSQQKYFYSSFFLYYIGPIPIILPGVYSIFFLLFFNLLSSLFIHFTWKWKKIGLIICHLGFLALLLGSFLIYHFTEEGSIHLEKSQSLEHFISDNKYELSVIQSLDRYERITIFPENLLKTQRKMRKKDLPLQIKIHKYFSNCRFVKKSSDLNTGLFKNYTLLLEKSEKPPIKAGCYLEIFIEEKSIGKLYLRADSLERFHYKNQNYALKLRKAKKNLPFQVQLVDFHIKNYPGTRKLKYIESQINIKDGSKNIKGKIELNKPIRYKGYIFYQISFDKKRSVLAVVKNPFWFFPYISSLLIFLGMLIHFAVTMFTREVVK